MTLLPVPPAPPRYKSSPRKRRWKCILNSTNMQGGRKETQCTDYTIWRFQSRARLKCGACLLKKRARKFTFSITALIILTSLVLSLEMWSAYFDETDPSNYRFIHYYEYRLKQADFSCSFESEARGLKRSLDNLLADGPDNVKEAVRRMRGAFKASFIYVSWNSAWLMVVEGIYTARRVSCALAHWEACRYCRRG